MRIDKRFIVIFSFISFLSIILLIAQQKKENNSVVKGHTMENQINKTEKEWKEKLTPEEFRVLREKGTERPFTGKYWDAFEAGTYKCAACGQVLFDSKTKFDAGCGWPSFSEVISNKNVVTKNDYTLGMHRVEVMCSNCGGHLGHVFDDGPAPTGERFCINSVSIKFEKKAK